MVLVLTFFFFNLVIKLNPTNQTYQDFFILLSSLTKLKKKMGRLYYQDYKPKQQLPQLAQKQAATAVIQKKMPNSNSKSAKTAVIINSKIYQNEGQLTSLIMPKRTITTIEEAPVTSAAPGKHSSDDEYFKEELKILSIKDENLRNFKILSSDQRTTSSMLRKSTGGGGGESKFSQSFRQNSIKTKNSSIALEDSGEFESILKEFYELK